MYCLPIRLSLVVLQLHVAFQLLWPKNCFGAAHIPDYLDGIQGNLESFDMSRTTCLRFWRCYLAELVVEWRIPTLTFSFVLDPASNVWSAPKFFLETVTKRRSTTAGNGIVWREASGGNELQVWSLCWSVLMPLVALLQKHSFRSRRLSQRQSIEQLSGRFHRLTLWSARVFDRWWLLVFVERDRTWNNLKWNNEDLAGRWWYSFKS